MKERERGREWQRWMDEDAIGDGGNRPSTGHRLKAKLPSCYLGQCFLSWMHPFTFSCTPREGHIHATVRSPVRARLRRESWDWLRRPWKEGSPGRPPCRWSYREDSPTRECDEYCSVALKRDGKRSTNMFSECFGLNGGLSGFNFVSKYNTAFV